MRGEAGMGGTARRVASRYRIPSGRDSGKGVGAVWATRKFKKESGRRMPKQPRQKSWHVPLMD